MTNKEAIDILRNAAFLATSTSYQAIEEAVEVAVKALTSATDINVATKDCSDCIKHGGDYECDHVYCHKGKGDTIYRNDAIDALREEFKRIPTTAIRATHRIEQLPSAQPEQRWIPVTERLPEDSVYVLLTVRRMDDSYNHVPFISTGYISWNHQCWWCAHDGNCKDANIDVIAWMPLPEPYEEDPCNRCGYLGESCVGEGCGKLTERKDGEANERSV